MFKLNLTKVSITYFAKKVCSLLVFKKRYKCACHFYMLFSIFLCLFFLLQYTCFDISRHYMVFGTNTGGVVFLQHDTLSYIKTVTAKVSFF